MRGVVYFIIVMLVASSLGCISEKIEKPDKKRIHGPKTKKIEEKRPVDSTRKRLGVVSGKWEQLNGMDGGDMHFIYSTRSGVLFVSHGFGGVWRSKNGGESWEIIKQEDFTDVYFYDMEEIGEVLYAGSNKGLWYSLDEGESWTKLKTGFPEIDDGTYHLVSLAKYKDELFFTAVLDKKYRNGRPGDGRLFVLKRDKTILELEVPANKEITVSAKYPYLFISSPYSGLFFSTDGKRWRKILDKKTTNVFVDGKYNLYVGTIGDWWYIGRKIGNTWKWEQVKIPGRKNTNSIFYFLVPDPINENRLWFGCGGVSRFYSFSAKGFGNSFFGVGCWNGELKDWKIHSNYATSIAFYGDEKVKTSCGEATKYALVTVGGQAVQKTMDGGLNWSNSYEGVFGDTINAINPIKSGILSGTIVVTAVSGTEIAFNNGEEWMRGIDLRLGKEVGGGKLPGYPWCAVSPERRIEGKYDLLISTGYPSPFRGDGVFGIDTSCLVRGGRNCVKKLIGGPHYEMVISEGKLYAGNMDNGIDVLDLETMEVSKIDFGSGVPLIRKFDGKLFFETYEGKYLGDGWRWSGKKGKIYFYDGRVTKTIYEEYAINFSVNNREFIALTPESLVYKPDFLSEEEIRVKLPNKKYTDMAIAWEKGIIFLSTDGEGVFYTTIDELKSGGVRLKEFNNGLLTLKIRNLVYEDGYLFAGTRGYSVWRVKPSQV